MGAQLTYPRTIAVLTGDIVGSTALGAKKLERAMSALEDCAQMQAEWMGESLHFTRHRGDGWQVALAEPKYALRSTIAFRATLKALGEDFDSYIGIAEGVAPHPLQADLNDETSLAFVESGQALENIKSSSTGLRISYDKAMPADSAAILLNGYISKWTRVQAQAVKEILSPDYDLNFSKTAIKLGKTRQTVTKTIRASEYELISIALASIEKWMEAQNV